MNNKRLIYLLIAILFIWALILSFVLSNKNNLQEINEISEYNVSGFSTDLSKVYDENKSSIVAIEHDGKISTGFIYTKKDNLVYIVSTYHGVSNSGSINIYFNSGVKTKGNLYAYDIYKDLALIEVEFDYDVKPVSIGNSSLLKTGEFVLGIGSAESLEYAFSSQFGMVSKNYREVLNNIVFNNSNHAYYLGVIQLSGEFSKGYSGCPIFNMQGEVIGVLTMKENEVSLALPINEVKILVDKMLNGDDYHSLDLGMNGLYINDLEKYEATHLNIPVDIVSGYYIENILNNSLASSLGLNKGDIILSINNIKINKHEDMLNVIYSDIDVFEIIVNRGGENITLKGSIDYND